MRALTICLHLVRLEIKSRMEYRGAFIVHTLAMFLNYASAFTAIWILLEKFGSLGGWIWPEIALLLGFQLLAYALGAATSFVQFRNFEEMIRKGDFDALLVKPFSPWAYITFSGLHTGYAGHIILALGLMGWSLTQLNIPWSPGLVVYGIFALINGCLVVAAVMTMIGISAMVLVQSRHLYHIFFGFWQLTRYPINIFPVALQWLLVTIIPLGYMNYVPVAAFLGKDVAILGHLGPGLSLVSGPVSLLAAVAFWRFCLDRYQGAGG
jgi:ABC-2 type transport system permease protein